MEQQEKIPLRRPLAEAGVAYSVGAVLPLVLSLVVSFVAALAVGEGYVDAVWYRFFAYLLPQVCFAVTAVLFFRRSKVGVRETVGRCKWHYFVLALLMQFGLMFSLGELNEMFLGWLEGLGYHSPQPPLPPLDGWYLLPAIFVIALLPAIFEEVLFRGILVGRMQAAGWGTWATVLLSGALFSLYHASPAQTIYQFLCGMCFALLVVQSGSILPSMVAHFCNNAAILVLTSTGYGVEGGWTMPMAWEISLVVCAAVCLAATLALLLFDKSNEQRGGVKGGQTFFLPALVGMSVCAVQWIYLFIAGWVTGG